GQTIDLAHLRRRDDWLHVGDDRKKVNCSASGSLVRTAPRKAQTCQPDTCAPVPKTKKAARVSPPLCRCSSLSFSGYSAKRSNATGSPENILNIEAGSDAPPEGHRQSD